MDMVKSLCMCTLLSQHGTCVWGNVLRELGTRAVILKPLTEACQAKSDGIYYLYHITKTEISFSPFWLLRVPIPLSLSFYPLRIRFLQCVKFIAVRSYVSSNSTLMVVEVLNLRASLRLWKRFPFNLEFSHIWILRFCQNLLSSSIWLFLHFYILNTGCYYHWKWRSAFTSLTCYICTFIFMGKILKSMCDCCKSILKLVMND